MVQDRPPHRNGSGKLLKRDENTSLGASMRASSRTRMVLMNDLLDFFVRYARASFRIGSVDTRDLFLHDAISLGHEKDVVRTQRRLGWIPKRNVNTHREELGFSSYHNHCFLFQEQEEEEECASVRARSKGNFIMRPGVRWENGYVLERS